MALSINSTLKDILANFVSTDASHDPTTATFAFDGGGLRLFWPDNSRIRIDIQTMSMSPSGVRMLNPAPLDMPGGGNSNNPPAAPVLSTLTPNTAVHGGAAFDLVITGTGFSQGSKISFGTAVGDAVWISTTQLKMTIAPAAYANAGTVQVTVMTRTGLSSNALSFTVT